MHIKRYTIASFLLMALVGWYVYAYITQESISIDLFGIHLPSFSIAAWVVIVMFIFYLASVFHISFYSIVGNFRLRKYEKDFEKAKDAIVAAYLGKKDREHVFKTQRYKLLGSLIDHTKMMPQDNLIDFIEDEKIKSVLETISKIKQGEIVELKKYSLDKDNEFVVQNLKNRYANNKISADEILNNEAKYNKKLCEFVYIDFVKTAPLKSIEKYSDFLSREALFEIIFRINNPEKALEITNESLIALLNKLQLNEDEYIDLSRKLSLCMLPDQRLALFESMSNKKEEVMAAYLYTLFDLEMVEHAYEILQNSQENEFLNFKAYKALKENNQNFSIDIFVS